jgi:hypothetical protein
VRPSAVKLNANRQVSGTMRGFDQFMNIVLDKAHDDKLDVDLGMVVGPLSPLHGLPACGHATAGQATAVLVGVAAHYRAAGP